MQKKNAFSYDSAFLVPLMYFFYAFFLIGILLLPFGNRVETGLQWLGGDKGIKITSPSVIRSFEPPQKIYDALIDGAGITLNAWITADSDDQTGPARIVSYSHGKGLRNFTLGQNNKDLIFRLRTDNNLNGLPEVVVDDVFVDIKPLHLAITYDFTQFIVYVNGEVRGREFRRGDFSNWDPFYFLMVANELSSDRPWLGTIHEISIYNRTLSCREIQEAYNDGGLNTRQTAKKTFASHSNPIALYLFNEEEGALVHDHSTLKPGANLYIPAVISVGSIPDQKILVPPEFTNIKDIIVNIVLFVPFGYLLHTCLNNSILPSFKSFNTVLLAGIIFTFSIESLQSLIQTRSSSMTDVICNSLGVIVGIVVDSSIKRRAGHF